MSKFERSMTVLTIGQAVIAVLTGLILLFQLMEMKSGSKDTNDLALAAKAQSDASKAIADSSKAQSDATASIATATIDEVAQLKASNGNAVGANRAWMVMDGSYPTENP